MTIDNINVTLAKKKYIEEQGIDSWNKRKDNHAFSMTIVLTQLFNHGVDDFSQFHLMFLNKKYHVQCDAQHNSTEAKTENEHAPKTPITQLIKSLNEKIFPEMAKDGISIEDLSPNINGVDIKFVPANIYISTIVNNTSLANTLKHIGLYQKKDHTDDVFKRLYNGNRREYCCPIEEYNPYKTCKT
jgi:hypothetical protein